MKDESNDMRALCAVRKRTVPIQIPEHNAAYLLEDGSVKAFEAMTAEDWSSACRMARQADPTADHADIEWWCEMATRLLVVAEHEVGVTITAGALAYCLRSCEWLVSPCDAELDDWPWLDDEPEPPTPVLRLVK